MKTKHTQGEWTVDSSEYGIVIQTERYDICKIIDEAEDINGVDTLQSLANAKLISAAPELLAACEIAVKAYKELGLKESQNCYEQALKAIKKATQ